MRVTYEKGTGGPIYVAEGEVANWDPAGITLLSKSTSLRTLSTFIPAHRIIMTEEEAE